MSKLEVRGRRAVTPAAWMRRSWRTCDPARESFKEDDGDDVVGREMCVLRRYVSSPPESMVIGP
jgi:hypothetical protein